MTSHVLSVRLKKFAQTKGKFALPSTQKRPRGASTLTIIRKNTENTDPPTKKPTKNIK